MHPDVVTTNIVMYNYIVINKMTKHPNFHQLSNQRIAATTITFNILADEDALFPEDLCASGHSTEEVTKKILWASTNAMLNNYCSKENNCLAENKMVMTGKKRKLETLTKPVKKNERKYSPKISCDSIC